MNEGLEVYDLWAAAYLMSSGFQVINTRKEGDWMTFVFEPEATNLLHRWMSGVVTLDVPSYRYAFNLLRNHIRRDRRAA